MARNKPEEVTESLTVLKVGELYEPFSPWRRDEKGTQVYIKLTRGEDESRFLFVGQHLGLQADVQQALMRLVNEGWHVEGEVQVRFDGRAEPGTDPYVYQVPLCIELGAGLLPIADPQNGSPLLTKLEAVREDVASELGLVTPPIQVVDNLRLEADQYLIRIKNAPAASAEVFLDRLMVLGNHQQLDALEGWATHDPIHRMRAKWIEADLREKAENIGCVVLGPLAVMVTHLKGVIGSACPELLGLQETFEHVQRLQSTHPVVVEDFLSNRTHLRRLRRILQSLLMERVSIRDLVTILETAGDHLENLDRTEMVTESCRRALARQICSSYVNQEGVLRALALGPKTEEILLAMATEGQKSQTLSISKSWVENFISEVKKQLEEHKNPPVLLTDPPSRLLVRRLLASQFPGLGILATTEIASGFRVEPCGQVECATPEGSSERQPEEGGGKTDSRREGMFGFLKGN